MADLYNRCIELGLASAMDFPIGWNPNCIDYEVLGTSTTELSSISGHHAGSETRSSTENEDIKPWDEETLFDGHLVPWSLAKSSLPTNLAEMLSAEEMACCWGFADIMPLLRSYEESQRVPQSICEEAAEYLTESAVSQPQPVPYIIRVFTEENCQFRRLHSVQMVGRQAVFYVDKIHPSQLVIHFEKVVTIELTRPGGSSEKLQLREDPEPGHPGRYFCSFCPSETGQHIISATVNLPNSDLDGFSCSMSRRRHVVGSPITFGVSASLKLEACNPIRNDPQCQKDVFGNAWGIAVYRPTNLIFVADRRNSQVMVLDENLEIVRKFGGEGSNPGQLLRPTGVAIDHVHRRVVICDAGNHRISAFGLEGNFIIAFGKEGHGKGELDSPCGVAVSPCGSIIPVTDSYNYRVQFFNFNGRFVRQRCVFGESEEHGKSTVCNYPRGIAFSLDGNRIYMTEFRMEVLLALKFYLTKQEMFAPVVPLNRPQGIAVDEVGHVLVADSYNDAIPIISQSGILISTKSGPGLGERNHGVNLAVLRGGKVVVLDENNEVHVF